MADCPHCEEPVLPGEAHPALVNMQNFHRECAIRMICGSLAHIEKRCHCFFSDSTETDPPGMTVREAAKAAQLALARTPEYIPWGFRLPAC